MISVDDTVTHSSSFVHNLEKLVIAWSKSVHSEPLTNCTHKGQISDSKRQKGTAFVKEAVPSVNIA